MTLIWGEEEYIWIVVGCVIFIAQIGVASSSVSIEKHFMLVARLVDRLIEIGEMAFLG